MEYKKQSNCSYYCVYHIILVSKYRRKIFNNGIHNYMKQQLKELKEYYPQLEIENINHDKDHIHIMIWIPPKMSVGQVVRVLKSNTSRNLKQKFPFLKKVYFGTESIWSGGYFVSTVGINEEVISKYIDKQGLEDSGQTKFEI